MKASLCIVLMHIAGVVVAATVLPKDDARIWQTVFSPNDPLTWRWAEDSTRAEVVVSNMLNGAVSSSGVVNRAEGAKYGSCAMPDPARNAETGEGLVDVQLRQYDSSSSVVYSRKARLAFLPGVNGGEFNVEKGGAKFGRHSSSRVVPYDAAWAGASGASRATAVFTPPNGEIEQTALGSWSGFFAHHKGQGTLAVEFEGSEDVLVSQVYIPLGLILNLK